MTEGCAHCARREAELVATHAQYLELLAACVKTVKENGHLADGDNCTLRHLVVAIAKSAVKRPSCQHPPELQMCQCVLTAKLAAISRQVAALEAEWRAEKAENEREAEECGSAMGGILALERASKLEDCADALQTLRESIKGA